MISEILKNAIRDYKNRIGKMDIFKIIQKRRSIRKYKQKPVTDVLLTKILEAGRWAPSGLNNQPWRFMVIKNTARKSHLAGFTKYGHIIKKAAVVILVFIDRRIVYNRDKDLMATGACIQNMLLTAHSLRIGTCWLGEILKRKKEINNYLQLPAQPELMAAISLGYSAEKARKGKRRSLKSIVLKEQR